MGKALSDATMANARAIYRGGVTPDADETDLRLRIGRIMPVVHHRSARPRDRAGPRRRPDRTRDPLPSVRAQSRDRRGRREPGGAYRPQIRFAPGPAASR